MNLFPSRKPNPVAISSPSGELRDIVERLHDRLAMAEATIEAQATEIATLRHDGKQANGALCQLANDAAPAIKTHERLDSLQKNVDVHGLRLSDLERSDLGQLRHAIEQSNANLKALADRLKLAEDRLSVQAGIIQAAELSLAGLRDEIANRLSALETTVARLRSERDSRLKDAIRVLSGEATILVAHPVSESVKVINRDTGGIREIKIP